MYIDIEQKGVTGFFHFSIEFRDLGAYVISPQKVALEWYEKQIQSDYEYELNAQIAYNSLQTAVQKATDKSYQARLNAQKNADSAFFKALFSEHSLASKNFVITSPFESYAGSSGSYIVDTDYWQINGDNAIYTGLLEFEKNKSEFVPYVIEKLAKELFPKANITKFKDGCYINGTF